MKPKKKCTLADCTVSISLRCMHCDREFSKSARLEQFDAYVVLECTKCHCMTPFRVEKST